MHSRISPLRKIWAFLSKGGQRVNWQETKIWISLGKCQRDMPLLLNIYELQLWSCPSIWCRANSRFAPSQWETALLCNDVSHWLDASLESAMIVHRETATKRDGWISVSVIEGWRRTMLNHRTIPQTPVSGSCCLPLEALQSMWATLCKILVAKSKYLLIKYSCLNFSS